MRINKIEVKQAPDLVAVLDSCVGDGYLQGTGGVLADVDIDYQSDRRGEVKEYLERRYNTGGKQRVFSAGTLTTLKIKAAIKDVARVHKVPLSITNYITAIFDDDKMTWTDLFKLAATNRKVKDFITRYPQVIEDIRPLMGQPRSASVHASAILITPETKDGQPMECFDYTPIKKVDGVLVSEFDGYSLDEVGLLKNDCLGIKELSKINQTINECNRVYNAGLSFEEIVKGDLDDEKTYQILSDGHCQNVFQFSSRGMTKYLMDMRPDCINDLIAANALYRPATLESGSAEKYLLCKRGEVEPQYLWGTYDALKDSFGQLTYQESLAQIAREVGGFSLGEGVSLLKLISKKRIDKIHAMKEKFLSGAAQRGCPEEDAVKIWEMIESGGSYLFNKSHATAYAITAYVGAYLKANFPTAFYTVALQWADDKEISTLMSEMEQCSVAKIVPPDINVSDVHFTTDYAQDKIFWSLTRIKMVGSKAASYVIEERTKNGLFTSLENFIHRIFKHKLKRYEYWDDPDNTEQQSRVPVNARHIRNMILAGCFDNIEGVDVITDRYRIVQQAAELLGFTLSEQDFPADMVLKPHYWSMQQIALSGVG
ncbi:DNA polymerase III alpha subunit [Mucinivorans hirudinis]|uniref:DNA-directed DNA polymerase n=1 Tax=Mucinivorans hirudinis TaxID=1433126 RepID=A0A060RD14_9BACT|nr:DNA polymerase III alpha subunit [Mucinivorans hirudinis]